MVRFYSIKWGSKNARGIDMLEPTVSLTALSVGEKSITNEVARYDTYSGGDAGSVASVQRAGG